MNHREKNEALKNLDQQNKTKQKITATQITGQSGTPGLSGSKSLEGISGT